MMSEKEFRENTGWKMTYEEYKKCYCPDCSKTDCIHRGTFRRVPGIDGGLGLCPNLNGELYKLRTYKLYGNLEHEEVFNTKEEMDKRYNELLRLGSSLNPTAWKYVNGEWKRLEGY